VRMRVLLFIQRTLVGLTSSHMLSSHFEASSTSTSHTHCDTSNQ